ncbi:MAG: hypothetical protein CMK64_06380 [Pseudoalteromonas sp.]|nr:hypothetical protein [Pseudoalteromonas sp.]
MEFKKSVLALGVLTVLSGCGSSDDDKKTTPVDNVAVTSDIKGVASKGTFINAPVYFYKYVDGAAVRLTEEELGAASTMTDENGQYSAKVKVDGLVKVEIGISQDISSPTYMICDAPAGCGQNAKGEAIGFGEQINMTVKDPTFTLTSLISAAKNEGDVENTANITPLTHFATALAEQRGNVSAESVSKAQSEIADTFGLIGALNELVPAKVEDQASLVDDDESDNLRYALINAGIAQALFVGSEGNVGDMSARLNSAITDLVAADGAFLVSRDNDDDAEFELTLEDILKGAEQATQQIIVLIKKDPVLAKNLSRIADFELLVTKLNNDLAKKKKDAGEDGRSKGTETDVTEGDAVAKAAAMVKDIRVFANLFDVADTSGKEVQTQGEEFVQLVEDAGTMVEEQAESFKLLADVSEALAVIDSLRRAGEITINTVDLKNYLALPGATGTATLDEDGLTFNVQATAGNESLSAKAAVTSNEANTEYTLKVDGIIENDAAKFTLNEGTQVSVTLNKAVTADELKSDTFDLEAHGIEAVKGALNLELTLAQKKTDEVTNPVSFSGQLSAELVPVIEESLENDLYTMNWQPRDSAIYYRIRQEVNILPKMLYLGGDFSSEQGNRVSANLTVNIENAEGFEAAGFSYFGEKVTDVASFKYTSENVALITHKDNSTKEYKLVSNGEDGTVVYQMNTAEYNFTGWLTEFEGLHYKISRTVNTGEDPAEVTNWIRRLVYSDYMYVDQYAPVTGEIESFNNGVITLKDGSVSNVNELSWTNNLRSHSLAELREFIGTVESVAEVTDLHSFLNEPEFKLRNSNVIEGQGHVRIEMPDSKSAVGETVTLNGRYVSKETDANYVVTVNSAGTQTVATLGNVTNTYTMAKDEKDGFVYSEETLIQNNYRRAYKVEFTALENLSAGTPYFYTTSYEYEYLGDDTGNTQPPVPELPPGEIIGQYVLPVINNDVKSYELYDIHSVSFDGVKFVDTNGERVDPLDYAYFHSNAQTLDDAVNSIHYGSFSLTSEYPAIEGFIADGRNNSSIYLEGKGRFDFWVDNKYTNDAGEETTYASSVTPGSTVNIPTYFKNPEDTFELEDENNFLDISAALNVDVVLGDYAVDLTLSGQRTELEQGKLELDIKYIIPGSDAQRSFMVEYDTKTESLSAKNTEGVSLVLVDKGEISDEDADAGVEVEIGKIMVGEEVAATILKRDSIVLIKYTDGVIESL